MCKRTRKLMMMYTTLYPRYNVGRLYESRKEGGTGLTSIHDSVDKWIQQLEDYIQSAEEDWLQRPEAIQTTQKSTEQK